MTWPEYRIAVCRIDGRLTRLRSQEAEMLIALLLAKPDQWLSVGDLTERVWPDPDFEPDGAVSLVSKLLSSLRAKAIQIEHRHSIGWRIPAEARGRPEKVFAPLVEHRKRDYLFSARAQIAA